MLNGRVIKSCGESLMSRKEKLHVAIAGYGLAGACFHAPLIKSTSGLAVKAIVTRSADKQVQARLDFPDAAIFSGLADMLSAAKALGLDLAVIATPNREHAPQSIACLEAGLAVVVDKPAALNSRECIEMIAASKRGKSLLSVFQNRRWDNDFLTLKKLIEEGRLGKILRFESRFERYRPAPRAGAWRETLGFEEGGGVLFDLGSHLIDQATQLFGKPEQVYAEMNVRRAGVGSDDDSFVALSFPSGVKAHLWTSAIAAAVGCRFRLLGAAGAYEKYGLDPQEEALRSGKTPAAESWGVENPANWGKLTTYDNGDRRELAFETVPGAYQRYYEIMRDALQGLSEVPVAAEDALTTLRIIEAARLSAVSRTPQALLIS
jgi:scyllo-inositol 2-dehydrogenase (NADP+)